VPRKFNRLSGMGAARAIKPGLYPNGGNLYRKVTPPGVKSWVFRYTLEGRAHGMGLGPLHTIPLAEARRRAQAARQLLLDGIDPLHSRAQAEARKAAAGITFGQCALAYMNAHEAAWRSRTHAREWRRTLEVYAYPVLGEGAVNAVDTAHVLRVLAAVVTKGGTWPVDGTTCEQGEVLFISAEDDMADTIKPRLVAAGADVGRCHFLKSVAEPHRRNGGAFNLAKDVHALEAWLSARELRCRSPQCPRWFLAVEASAGQVRAAPGKTLRKLNASGR
jgi:Arm domain-containing DNA-binding protein/integrase-like protein/AAA domain-containing protein